jgi:hypothetical protein
VIRKLRDTFRDPTTALPVLGTVIGLALVGAGWVIQGSSYVPGLLQQFGSALVMLVPLLYLGNLLEKRMRRTEEQARAISHDLARVRSDVAATAAMVDALRATNRDDVERSAQQRSDAFADARRSLSYGAVARVLAEAAAISAVAPAGLRVRLGRGDARLRMPPPGDGDLRPTVERAGGEPIAVLTWRPGEDAGALHERVSAAVGVEPGDLADAYLHTLVEALRTAVAGNTGELPVSLGPVLEIPNDEWVVAADGLHCLKRPYDISRERLLDRREDWPRYMGDKDWVTPPKFAEAYDVAVALLS